VLHTACWWHVASRGLAHSLAHVLLERAALAQLAEPVLSGTGAKWDWGLSGTGLSSLVHVLLERAALVQLAEPVVERHDQPEDVGVEVPREPNASGLSTVQAAWPGRAVSTRVTRWVRYSQPATVAGLCLQCCGRPVGGPLVRPKAVRRFPAQQLSGTGSSGTGLSGTWLSGTGISGTGLSGTGLGKTGSSGTGAKWDWAKWDWG
jgi:hypothetical protein